MLDELDHPHVLPVLGRNLSASPPWFVVPQADSNLDDEIHKHGLHQDRQWVLDRFREILLGVGYAHDRRVVHRDLKPENVLMIEGRAVVADFGLGKRLDTNTVDVTQSHIGMGTLRYMAPEQFDDFGKVSFPADVYALGKLFAEMLSGRRPDIGRMDVSHLPPEYRSFVQRCVADHERDRYATAGDALAAFDLLIGGGEERIAGSLEEFLNDWENEEEGKDAAEVLAVATYLVENDDDEKMFYEAIPRLPSLLVQQIRREHPDLFDRILRSYNAHVQGSLPFEYCDVLANFYRDVIEEDPDPDHQRLILDRLIELGPSHNRWHVGDVVADILMNKLDDAGAEVAAQAVRADPVHAHWYRGYVRNRDLPGVIRKAFDDISPTAQSDVPF